MLQRRASIYLTWLLLRTSLMPNQGTLSSVGCGLLSGVLLATRPAETAIAGLSRSWRTNCSKADGDIARFRKSYFIVGVYLDELGHGVAFAGMFAGLGLHVAGRTPSGEALMAVLLTSTLGAMAMVLCSQHKSAGFLFNAQNVLAHPESTPRSRADGWSSALTRDVIHRSSAERRCHPRLDRPHGRPRAAALGFQGHGRARGHDPRAGQGE